MAGTEISPGDVDLPFDRAELMREATTMVLYLSVVEIAEIAALPEGRSATGQVTGAVGATLLAVIWGTAVGLALAHWFAFRVAAPAFRGDRVTRHDTLLGLAQVGGALFVACVSSLPALLPGDRNSQLATGLVLASIIGVVGYVIARSSGRTRTASAFYGITALALGLLVAFVKSALAAH
jgi:hypothetical protein